MILKAVREEIEKEKEEEKEEEEESLGRGWPLSPSHQRFPQHASFSPKIFNPRTPPVVDDMAWEAERRWRAQTRGGETEGTG
ncbi:hypothetical protein E2C01_076497 [Portunus trituberculatus]|uniref:Uncharacterized protein n=1 Tax=Portunus trituberculatus TaxID=210409 RepID=A0A5B7IIZ2_PORTR|nr:hypothetical protein [Portunus trituberculatus]